MDKLKHVKPLKEHEEDAINYIKEFYKYNSNINGSGGLDRYLDDSNSATINQVTQKMLLALPIPLPPHQEQHRIVAKIEELFAQLDKIEASL